nr:hypothetical protein [Tanacetum cinerariifolium]
MQHLCGTCAGRLQLDTFDLAHQQDVRQRPKQRQNGDVGDCRRERVTRREEANHDRRGNRRQVTDQVERAAGQSQQPRRSKGRYQRPGDRGQAIAEKRQCQERDHQRGRIHVVGADDRSRDQQAGDDRRFTGKTHRVAATDQPVGEEPRA